MDDIIKGVNMDRDKDEDQSMDATTIDRSQGRG